MPKPDHYKKELARHIESLDPSKRQVTRRRSWMTVIWPEKGRTSPGGIADVNGGIADVNGGIAKAAGGIAKAAGGIAKAAGGIIADAILSIVNAIVNGVAALWRNITKFLRRYALIFGTLMAGLVVGCTVRLFAGNSSSLSRWGLAATLVVVSITIGIVFYSVIRRRKNEERYKEYMEMLSKVNEEGEARYKRFFE
jgi:hypothetical protein